MNNNNGAAPIATITLHWYSALISMQKRPINIVVEPPHAHIRAKNIFARPLDSLGRYSIKSVIPWGMQDMSMPTKNRNINSHIKDGESAEDVPNKRSEAEDPTNTLRRP